MKLNRVLVVYKPRIGGSLKPGAQPAWVRMRQRQHEMSIGRVKEALESEGVAYDVIHRGDLSADLLEGNLLIAIGGDGTVLAAAHVTGDIPILGVNSMPGHSVGFFCLAEGGDFKRKLGAILKDRIRPKGLPLIEARIDSRPVAEHALNEILFAAATPAETVRYRINAGGRTEMQRSSGVWIAAGPGSTAAIRSAGGRPMAIDSGRLQYLVREPYPMPGRRYRLLRGILKAGEKTTIKAEMGDAHIYIDGPKVSYPVPMGSKLTAVVSRRSLSIFL